MNETLYYPFEAELLQMPAAGARAIVFNAQPGMRLPQGFGARLDVVQGFRPDFLKLQDAGNAVAPEPGGGGFDLGFVTAGRHRRQNEAWVADVLARTGPGATILVAGGKTDGIASLRKRVGNLVPIAGSASKHHGVVFWIERPTDPTKAIDSLTTELGLVDGRFSTSPGGFSVGKIDAGSRLLFDSLPHDIKGKVADFCAGWGYLSARLAERQAVASIDLYEADFASLEAARGNMARLAPDMTAAFHWIDLASELVTARYDAIVMNPPFHQGRAAQPDIGLVMIRAAHNALKPAGRLFLVANRGLPYEAEFMKLFSASGEIIRNTGFKVIWGKR